MPILPPVSRSKADRTRKRSNRNLWGTPPWLIYWIERHYGPIDIDVAANSSNHVCNYWFGPKHPNKHRRNALTVNWFGAYYRDRKKPWKTTKLNAFCNPPYNKPRQRIQSWVDMAIHEVQLDRIRVILLLPSDTSTVWFHDILGFGAATIHFFEGRIPFIHPETRIPIANNTGPSVLIVLNSQTPRKVTSARLGDPIIVRHEIERARNKYKNMRRVRQ